MQVPFADAVFAEASSSARRGAGAVGCQLDPRVLPTPDLHDLAFDALVRVHIVLSHHRARHVLAVVHLDAIAFRARERRQQPGDDDVGIVKGRS